MQQKYLRTYAYCSAVDNMEPASRYPSTDECLKKKLHIPIREIYLTIKNYIIFRKICEIAGVSKESRYKGYGKVS